MGHSAFFFKDFVVNPPGTLKADCARQQGHLRGIFQAAVVVELQRLGDRYLPGSNWQRVTRIVEDWESLTGCKLYNISLFFLDSSFIIHI